MFNHYRSFPNFTKLFFLNIIFIVYFICLKYFALFFIFLFVLDFDFLIFLIHFVPLLLVVAFTTVFERKLLGGFQRRRGPNAVGVFGILQAFADALKLLSKETIVPTASNYIIFVVSPLTVFLFSGFAWLVLPLSGRHVIANLDTGIL